MRKFLCVLALAGVATTGWFFWPRIASELEAQFPGMFEQRNELHQPTPEAAPSTETESPEAIPEATPATEAETPEAAPIVEPTETKTSLRIDGSGVEFSVGDGVNEASAWF